MIGLDKQDGIWTATINRPDRANSLTEPMLTDLAGIAEAASGARALILTGPRGRQAIPAADIYFAGA